MSNVVSVKSLQSRARTSEDRESYEPIAKGRGFRVGVGARSARPDGPTVFVEVVLDPFPDRPRVDPDRLAAQGARLAWLEAHGYLVECADDGTITCERSVEPKRAAGELRAVQDMLGGKPRDRPTRRRNLGDPKHEP